MSAKGRQAGTAKSGRDYSRGSPAYEHRSVSYGDSDPAGLQGAIESITLSGDAVLFGRTSDGGALVVRVLSGGKSYVHYPTTSEALNELLTELEELAKA